MSMTRKEFLQSVLGVGVGAAVLAACGDDGGSTEPTADAGPHVCTTPTNMIGSNHGHKLTVTFDDVDGASAKTYDITGTADHSHDLTITAAQFAQIMDGQTLTITTKNGPHTHRVTVKCLS
jgi:hypothetical protein